MATTSEGEGQLEGGQQEEQHHMREQRVLWNFFDKNVNLLDMCNKQVGAHIPYSIRLSSSSLILILSQLCKCVCVCDVQTNNNNVDDAGEIREWADLRVRVRLQLRLRVSDSTTFIIIFLLFFIDAFWYTS